MKAKSSARIHAILARDADKAVVFRRGPSNKTAVFGWDLREDKFKLGQWFVGSVYPYRGDLSPDGKHLIYFAAKYKRAARDETAERASWTAISRTPYLKALTLWFNGLASGWNGGGHFIGNRSVALNRAPNEVYPPREGSSQFKEVAPTKSCAEDFGWGACGGECPQAYLPRLIRDGWTLLGYDGEGWTLERPLRKGLVLRKRFLSGSGRGHAVYWERHAVLNEKGEVVIDGSDWGWADLDAPRKRIVFAEKGLICAMSLRGDMLRKVLFDANAVEYERIVAPY